MHQLRRDGRIPLPTRDEGVTKKHLLVQLALCATTETNVSRCFRFNCNSDIVPNLTVQGLPVLLTRDEEVTKTPLGAVSSLCYY